MTQTQEIITHSIWKFTNGYEGMCMSGVKFPKPWQVTDKIIEWLFFPIHIQPLTDDSNLGN